MSLRQDNIKLGSRKRYMMQIIEEPVRFRIHNEADNQQQRGFDITLRRLAEMLYDAGHIPANETVHVLRLFDGVAYGDVIEIPGLKLYHYSHHTYHVRLKRISNQRFLNAYAFAPVPEAFL
jgi:hypothetical protein